METSFKPLTPIKYYLGISEITGDFELDIMYSEMYVKFVYPSPLQNLEESSSISKFDHHHQSTRRFFQITLSELYKLLDGWTLD